MPKFRRRNLVIVATAIAVIVAGAASIKPVSEWWRSVRLDAGVIGAPIVGDDPVTIAFAGDVHFEDHLAPIAKDPHGLSSLTEYLATADVTVVNLETAVATGGDAIENKAFTFRTPPSALTTLANAGVDAVSLANNHGVDYGKAGLSQTLAARDNAPIPMIGIGANEAEAFAPSVFEVDGVSIAVLAATQLREETTVYFSATPDKPGVANMIEMDRITAAVQDAAATHDVVVVVPHWGREKETCPTDKQVTAAEQLSQAGADIVVGGHSHRVMGSGWLDDTYVGYGLGNFVWFKNVSFAGRSSGVLTIEIDKQQVVEKRRARAAGRPAAGSVVVRDHWQPLSVSKSGIPVADPTTAAQMNADRAKAVKCSGLASERPVPVES